MVASKAALQCLLEAGDWAGALELLGNLSHLVGGQVAGGIAVFRHTPPQVVRGRNVTHLTIP